MNNNTFTFTSSSIEGIIVIFYRILKKNQNNNNNIMKWTPLYKQSKTKKRILFYNLFRT